MEHFGNGSPDVECLRGGSAATSSATANGPTSQVRAGNVHIDRPQVQGDQLFPGFRLAAAKEVKHREHGERDRGDEQDGEEAVLRPAAASVEFAVLASGLQTITSGRRGERQDPERRDHDRGVSLDDRDVEVGDGLPPGVELAGRRSMQYRRDVTYRRTDTRSMRAIPSFRDCHNRLFPGNHRHGEGHEHHSIDSRLRAVAAQAASWRRC
jgi:hypothetical protein